VSITLNTPTPITVPSDATADLSVNGISAALSDVVVINGVRCDVTAINDLGTPGTGAIANSSITVDCDANVTVTTGMVIGEQRSFTVTVDPNGFTPPGPETVTVTTTAEVQGTPALNDTDDTITTVEQLLTVTKYVRNVDTNAAGTGVPVLVDGNTYYPADVVGIPGETLEYLVLVENTSASNNATDTVISDPIPAFTTFNATNFAVINNAGVATAADPVADQGTDEGELVGNTVYLYPGSTTHGDDAASGGGNPNGDGGTIAAGEVAYGRFQVDID
jgi:hypothetical protein